MKSLKFKLIGLIAAVIVLGGILTIILLHKTSSSSLPHNIVSRASFSIFYPTSHVKGLDPKESTLSYSSANNGLSYLVLVNNKQVVVSEEGTPSIFNESGVYSYKLQQAHEYNSFSSTAGEVDLTRPSGINGQTLAWVNSKGTLTLARAEQNLSVSEWQLLFNNMSVVN